MGQMHADAFVTSPGMVSLDDLLLHQLSFALAANCVWHEITATLFTMHSC